MCDTLYVKKENGFWFAKNSDRSPNEPNLTMFYPKKKHTEKRLKATYIEIDQVETTNAILLIQPSWMWGGEMGVNEYGVCIGNEAIFTKSKGKKTPSLIGMDYLRIALERSKSTKEAVKVIIELLQTYGQGGNCGFDKRFFYDNSYLIADSNEAVVLETVGKEFTVKTIQKHANISNRISVEDAYDVSLETQKSFFKQHSEPVFTFFSQSNRRFCSIKGRLDTENTPTLESIISLLQSHPEGQSELKRYRKGSLGSPCMHASALGDHTTASMIVDYTEEEMKIYVSGSSTPCLSLFKRVFFGEVVPPVFSNVKKSAEYWLKHEKIRRAVFQGIVPNETYRNQLHEQQHQIFNLEAKYEKHQLDKLTFLDGIAKIEKGYFEAFKDTVKEWETHRQKSRGIFHKYDVSLGQNIFERDLKKRIEKVKGSQD